MSDLLSLLATLAGLVGLMAGLAGVMVRARRRRITGVLAIADELYQPTAHRSQVEIHEQVERGDEDASTGGR